jgi:hypothetical protein
MNFSERFKQRRLEAIERIKKNIHELNVFMLANPEDDSIDYKIDHCDYLTQITMNTQKKIR